MRIGLQGQPFLLLVTLLRQRGEVVSRDELRRTLWPEDTFVDFNHGLGTAVKKLREVLGDSASHPRPHAARLRMTVEAAGPYGQFCLDDHRHHNIVLLAAGSGITPMMAMLRYIDDLCLETEATLLYCVRTERDIIFGSELKEMPSRLKNFRYHVTLSRPPADWTGLHGHVSRELIESTVRDLPAQHFFICGPPSFMDASRSILLGLGVAPERIMQESFGAPPPAIVSPVAPPEASALIQFARTGKTCTVRRGQTLLEAAEEIGVAIPFSCRQGQCGTCKTKLLAGNVRMDAEAGLDSESKAQGFVLTCVGRADGAVQLDA